MFSGWQLKARAEVPAPKESRTMTMSQPHWKAVLATEPAGGGGELSRHQFLRLLGGGAALLDAAAHSSAQVTTSTVRLSSVVTPKDGGLYDDLLPDFEKQSGYRVALTTGEDVYG